MQTPVVSRCSAPTPVDDFVLLFLPPCGPHMTPLANRSSESGLLVSSSSEAPQGIDLSRPLFICTNANQAATCTYNSWPRVSPHYVVNHSSQPGATIHRCSDTPVLRGFPDKAPQLSFNAPRRSATYDGTCQLSSTVTLFTSLCAPLRDMCGSRTGG
jgi:hypothetical protein